MGWRNASKSLVLVGAILFASLATALAQDRSAAVME